MSKPRSPREAHDALFRALATDEISAASLIRRYAPQQLAEVLTGKPPRLLEGNLIRPRRGRIQADALFEVEVRGGGTVLVHVLFEHLSGPAPGTPLKLQEYMTAIWRRSFKTNRLRSLRPIIPVVICHGPHRGAVPESFLELVDVPEVLAGRLPLLDFGIEIHDLGTIPPSELADDAATRGALFALKISHVEDPPLGVLLEIARDLADRPEDSLVRIEGMGYVLGALRVSDERYEALLNSRDPEVCDMVLLTIAEREWRKGQAEGRAEIVLAQLENRFGPIPPHVVKRVRSADPSELLAWSAALLRARRLEDIFGPDAGI